MPFNNEKIVDMDSIIQKIKTNINLFKTILAAILILFVIIIIFLSSYYTIDTEEVGVILKFGKYDRISSPGLHFKLPLGVEKVYKVKTERVEKQEFGFRTITPGIRTEYAKEGYDEESLMLTGDLNVVEIDWIVQYRIYDPLSYLFKLSMVERSIRDVSEAVIRTIVGDKTFDEILQNREEIAANSQKELQEILNSYKSGIKIITIKLQDVNPPDKVKAAFNEVNESIQDRERAINQAQEIYNEQIPRARGEAERTLAKAQGFAIERVNVAKGDTAHFKSLIKEYEKAKRVTKHRLYLESLSYMLPRIKEIYIVDGDQKTLMPFLKIGKDGANDK